MSKYSSTRIVGVVPSRANGGNTAQKANKTVSRIKIGARCFLYYITFISLFDFYSSSFLC